VFAFRGLDSRSANLRRPARRLSPLQGFLLNRGAMGRIKDTLKRELPTEEKTG
jgi:hypothetical protein